MNRSNSNDSELAPPVSVWARQCVLRHFLSAGATGLRRKLFGSGGRIVEFSLTATGYYLYCDVAGDAFHLVGVAAVSEMLEEGLLQEIPVKEFVKETGQKLPRRTRVFRSTLIEHSELFDCGDDSYEG
jgi:hypothetical protein